MESDGYSLFTECHRLYMQGIRHALHDRLESAYGDDWFQRGVLSAVPDYQRETIQTDLARWPAPEHVNHLDAAHFGHIVRRNHAAAFANVVPELDLTLAQFDRLRLMRNDWAHVVPESLPLQRAVSATQLMKEVLLKLGCLEAVDIAAILDERNLEQVENPMLESASQREHSDERRDGESPEELPSQPVTLWHTLQGYLVAESHVERIETEEQRGQRGGGGQVQVTIRVSNIAPASEDRPEICFTEVRLSVPSSRRGREEVRLGELPSGQTVERQFELFSNEVAQFEYEVSGSVDQERYFRVQKKGGLPSNIVRPVLNAFAERFDVIGIKEPFNGALAAIADVQPTMSLADAARVRQELGQLLPTIDEKATAVNELSREFYLRKGSPLGIHCGEIASFIKDLGSKLQAVDEAIGGTNLEAIDVAVNDLKQLQLSVLQVEETIRKIRNA